MAESCAPSPQIFSLRSDRLPLIREAFRLEWLTIGWMTIEAVIAIAAGVTAGSLVLLAFGLDSVIELFPMPPVRFALQIFSTQHLGAAGMARTLPLRSLILTGDQ
jgi:hypothetical protein